MWCAAVASQNTMEHSKLWLYKATRSFPILIQDSQTIFFCICCRNSFPAHKKGQTISKNCLTAGSSTQDCIECTDLNTGKCSEVQPLSDIIHQQMRWSCGDHKDNHFPTWNPGWMLRWELYVWGAKKAASSHRWWAHNTGRARLKAGIKEATRRHQQRLERDLNMNRKEMWQALQIITGCRSKTHIICEAAKMSALYVCFVCPQQIK